MGAVELILILAIVVIVFGVGKLPNVMGQLGKGVKAFRDGMSDENKASAPPASAPMNTAVPGAAPSTPLSPPPPSAE